MQFNLNFLLVAVLATLSVGANACKNGMSSRLKEPIPHRLNIS